MKKIFCVLLLAVMALSLFSCGNDPETPNGMQLVSDDNVAYRFYVPQTWTVNTVDPPSAYFSMTDKSNVLVTTFNVEEPTKLDDYWTTCDTNYKAQFTEYAVIGEKQTFTVNEQNAIQYVYTFKTDGVDYKVMQTLVGHSGSIYIITYTSVPENYDLHTEEMDSIIGAFVFR